MPVSTPQLTNRPQPQDSGPMVPGPEGSPQSPQAQPMPNIPAGSGQAQAAPTPQPEPSPQATPQAPMSDYDKSKAKEGEEVDDLLSYFDNKTPKVDKKIAESHDIDSLLTAFKTGGETKPLFDLKMPVVAPKQDGETDQQYNARYWTEAFKNIGANMRANLGRNKNEQVKAFQSMYGDENVKLKGEQIFFRPDDKASFRKVDGSLFGTVTDFVMRHALEAVPIMAGVGATAGVEAGGLAATGGTGVVPVTGAALAAGGVADAGAREGLIQGIDTLSSKPMRGEDVDLKKEMAWNAGINVVAGSALGLASKTSLGKAISTKLSNVLSNASEDMKILQKGGEEIGKFAQVRSAFREFTDILSDSVGLPPASKEQVGNMVSSAVDTYGKRLSDNVSMVKNRVLELANKNDMKVGPSNMLKKMKEILDNEGVSYESNGLAQSTDKTTPFNTTGGKGELNRLITDYNEIFAKNSAGGIEPKDFLDKVELYNNLSNFSQASPREDAILKAYRQVKHAAASDRDAFYGNVLTNSGTPEEKIFRDAYSRYASQIDLVTDFQSKFATPQQRELLVDSFMKGSMADRNEMVDRVGGLLGQDSKEFSLLKGSIVNNLIENNLKEGVLDAKSVMKFMTKPENQGFMRRIFAPQEQMVFSKMLLEANKIPYGDVLTQSSKNTLEDGLGVYLTRMAHDAYGAVKGLFNLFGNNQKAIDWLTDEGFLSVARRAEGQEQRQSILEALDMMTNLKDKMKIIDVPTKLEGARKATVKKYLPMAGSAMGGVISDKLQAAPAPQPTFQP